MEEPIRIETKTGDIIRKISFSSRMSDGKYCRTCETAENDSVFKACGNVANKWLMLRFKDEEQENEWLTKMRFK